MSRFEGMPDAVTRQLRVLRLDLGFSGLQSWECPEATDATAPRVDMFFPSVSRIPKPPGDASIGAALIEIHRFQAGRCFEFATDVDTGSFGAVSSVLAVVVLQPSVAS